MSFFFGKRPVRKNKFTFSVTLPAAWAKNAKLMQGSMVNIEMLDDNSLRITPSSTEPPRTERAGCTNTQ